MKVLVYLSRNPKDIGGSESENQGVVAIKQVDKSGFQVKDI
jgi:hypothetical protein